MIFIFSTSSEYDEFQKVVKKIDKPQKLFLRNKPNIVADKNVRCNGFFYEEIFRFGLVWFGFFV